ncbi:MAG: hypothetical protein HOH03_08550 [Candidatus Marinimicrobia bacterium]|jgi:hypothetical protein|nr:hypothetical protein [Candidatus Neomarinimicrobiota bacterium]
MKRLWLILFVLFFFSCQDDDTEKIFLIGEWQLFERYANKAQWTKSAIVVFESQEHLDSHDERGVFGKFGIDGVGGYNYFYCETDSLLTLKSNFHPNWPRMEGKVFDQNSGCSCDSTYNSIGSRPSFFDTPGGITQYKVRDNPYHPTAEEYYIEPCFFTGEINKYIKIRR